MLTCLARAQIQQNGVYRDEDYVARLDCVRRPDRTSHTDEPIASKSLIRTVEGHDGYMPYPNKRALISSRHLFFPFNSLDFLH